jgi:DNA-binding FrmR family transcriptional regulator
MHTAVQEAEELAARLHKVEGQARGGHMVAEGAPAIDVLTQVAATRGALDPVASAVAERGAERLGPIGRGDGCDHARISRLVRW